MTRTGKIARLPREVRDQLNRRLRDGQKGGQVADDLGLTSSLAPSAQGPFLFSPAQNRSNRIKPKPTKIKANQSGSK
jgi:hypothetical protein